MRPSHNERSGPQRETGSTSDRDEALHPRITGHLLIDLRGLEDEQLRHECAELLAAPDGADVVLIVGDRWMVDYGALAVIREHADRLRIDVQGNCRAVSRWVGAIRTGQVLTRWEVAG